MEGSRRIVPPVVIPVLVVMAIAGYLLGSHGTSAPSTSASSKAPAPETRIASGSSVLLEYPAGWKPTRTTSPIPGLAIAHPLLLAPGGDADRAGLLSGQLLAGASSPLPASFLALVHGIPSTEILELANLQAYRYSELSGYGRTLDVYVIPTVGSNPTALVCYAAGGFSSYLQQCEQIVAKVSLLGRHTANELSPDPAYAAQLSALIAGLDGERLKLRREMHLQPADVGTLATTLADRFAGAAASVAALEPPQPASAAQTALASSLMAVRGAYRALAAVHEDPAGYADAERRVNEAETGLDSALESFALLGYNHT